MVEASSYNWYIPIHTSLASSFSTSSSCLFLDLSLISIPFTKSFHCILYYVLWYIYMCVCVCNPSNGSCLFLLSISKHLFLFINLINIQLYEFKDFNASFLHKQEVSILCTFMSNCQSQFDIYSPLTFSSRVFYYFCIMLNSETRTEKLLCRCSWGQANWCIFYSLLAAQDAYV